MTALAARQKFVNIPNVAKTDLMGAKRKRGRPAQAGKALEFDPTIQALPNPFLSLKRPAPEEQEVQPAKKRRGRPPKQK